MTSEHDTKEISTSDDYRLCSLFDTANRAGDVSSGKCCRIWELLSLDDPKPCLKWIMSVTPVIVWAIDSNGVYLYATGKGLEGVGVKPTDIVGRSVFDLFRYYPNVLQAVQRVLAGEQFVEEHAIAGHHFELQFIPVLNKAGIVSGAAGVALDITPRHQAESNLARCEQYYEQLFSALPVALVSATPRCEIIRLNPAAEKLFGYTTAQVAGRQTILLYQDPQQYEEICHVHVLDVPGELVPRLVTLRRADGSTFVSESLFAKVTNSAGNIEGLVDIHRDITREREAEQLILSHDQTLQAMIDIAPSMAFMLDADLKLLFVNQRFADYMHCSIEGLVGYPVQDMCDEIDEVCTKRLSIIRAVFGSGEPRSFVDCRQERWFDIHMVPVKDIDGSTSRVAVFMLDITDRVKQEEMERSQIAEELHEVVSEMLENHHSDHDVLPDGLVGKPLTRREVQVLTAIATGLSTKEIAYAFNVSTKTVESQRLSIMRKLQLFNIAALTKYALREGLISLDV